MEIIVILLFCLFTGFIGWAIANGKGRGVAGFWWSFFLGFIGWVVAACLEPSFEVRVRRAEEQARVMRKIMGE